MRLFPLSFSVSTVSSFTTSSHLIRTSWTGPSSSAGTSPLPRGLPPVSHHLLVLDLEGAFSSAPNSFHTLPFPVGHLWPSCHHLDHNMRVNIIQLFNWILFIPHPRQSGRKGRIQKAASRAAKDLSLSFSSRDTQATPLHLVCLATFIPLIHQLLVVGQKRRFLIVGEPVPNPAQLGHHLLSGHFCIALHHLDVQCIT